MPKSLYVNNKGYGKKKKPAVDDFKTLDKKERAKTGKPFIPKRQG